MDNLWILFSIDWFKGQIAGKSDISWENLWFPVDSPLSQPIENVEQFGFHLGFWAAGFPGISPPKSQPRNRSSSGFTKNPSQFNPITLRYRFTENYGKSPCFMGKLTISMAIFNSYGSNDQKVLSVNHHNTASYTFYLLTLDLPISDGEFQ